MNENRNRNPWLVELEEVETGTLREPLTRQDRSQRQNRSQRQQNRIQLDQELFNLLQEMDVEGNPYIQEVANLWRESGDYNRFLDMNELRAGQKPISDALRERYSGQMTRRPRLRTEDIYDPNNPQHGYREIGRALLHELFGEYIYPPEQRSWNYQGDPETMPLGVDFQFRTPTEGDPTEFADTYDEFMSNFPVLSRHSDPARIAIARNRWSEYLKRIRNNPFSEQALIDDFTNKGLDPRRAHDFLYLLESGYVRDIPDQYFYPKFGSNEFYRQLSWAEVLGLAVENSGDSMTNVINESLEALANPAQTASQLEQLTFQTLYVMSHWMRSSVSEALGEGPVEHPDFMIQRVRMPDGTMRETATPLFDALMQIYMTRYGDDPAEFKKFVAEQPAEFASDLAMLATMGTLGFQAAAATGLPAKLLVKLNALNRRGRRAWSRVTGVSDDFADVLRPAMSADDIRALRADMLDLGNRAEWIAEGLEFMFDPGGTVLFFGGFAAGYIAVRGVTKGVKGFVEFAQGASTVDWLELTTEWDANPNIHYKVTTMANLHEGVELARAQTIDELADIEITFGDIQQLQQTLDVDDFDASDMMVVAVVRQGPDGEELVAGMHPSILDDYGTDFGVPDGPLALPPPSAATVGPPSADAVADAVPTATPRDPYVPDRDTGDVGPPIEDPFAGLDTRGADDDDARMPPTREELEELHRQAEDEPDELDDIFAEIEQELDDAGVTVDVHPLVTVARNENRIPTQSEMREHIGEWGYRDITEWQNDTREGASPSQPLLFADGTRRWLVWKDEQGNTIHEEERPDAELPFLSREQQQRILRGEDAGLVVAGSDTGSHVDMAQDAVTPSPTPQIQTNIPPDALDPSPAVQMPEAPPPFSPPAEDSDFSVDLPESGQYLHGLSGLSTRYGFDTYDWEEHRRYTLERFENQPGPWPLGDFSDFLFPYAVTNRGRAPLVQQWNIDPQDWLSLVEVNRNPILAYDYRHRYIIDPETDTVYLTNDSAPTALPTLEEQLDALFRWNEGEPIDVNFSVDGLRDYLSAARPASEIPQGLLTTTSDPSTLPMDPQARVRFLMALPIVPENLAQTYNQGIQRLSGGQVPEFGESTDGVWDDGAVPSYHDLGSVHQEFDGFGDWEAQHERIIQRAQEGYPFQWGDFSLMIDLADDASAGWLAEWGITVAQWESLLNRGFRLPILAYDGYDRYLVSPNEILWVGRAERRLPTLYEQNSLFEITDEMIYGDPAGDLVYDLPPAIESLMLQHAIHELQLASHVDEFYDNYDIRYDGMMYYSAAERADPEIQTRLGHINSDNEFVPYFEDDADPFAGVDTRGADDDDARMPPTADELEERFRDAEEEPDELDDIFAEIEQELTDAGATPVETAPIETPAGHPLVDLVRAEERLPTQAEMREHITDWGYRDIAEWRDHQVPNATPPQPYLLAADRRRWLVWFDAQGNTVHEEYRPDSDIPYLSMAEQQGVQAGDPDALAAVGAGPATAPRPPTTPSPPPTTPTVPGAIGTGPVGPDATSAPLDFIGYQLGQQGLTVDEGTAQQILDILTNEQFLSDLQELGQVEFYHIASTDSLPVAPQMEGLFGADLDNRTIALGRRDALGDVTLFDPQTREEVIAGIEVRMPTALDARFNALGVRLDLSTLNLVQQRIVMSDLYQRDPDLALEPFQIEIDDNNLGWLRRTDGEDEPTFLGRRVDDRFEFGRLDEHGDFHRLQVYPLTLAADGMSAGLAGNEEYFIELFWNGNQQGPISNTPRAEGVPDDVLYELLRYGERGPADSTPQDFAPPSPQDLVNDEGVLTHDAREWLFTSRHPPGRAAYIRNVFREDRPDGGPSREGEFGVFVSDEELLNEWHMTPRQYIDMGRPGLYYDGVERFYLDSEALRIVPLMVNEVDPVRRMTYMEQRQMRIDAGDWDLWDPTATEPDTSSISDMPEANEQVIADITHEFGFHESDWFGQHEMAIEEVINNNAWHYGDFAHMLHPSNILARAPILAQWGLTPDQWQEIIQTSSYPPYLAYDGTRRFIIDRQDAIAYLVTNDAPSTMPTLEQQAQAFGYLDEDLEDPWEEGQLYQEPHTVEQADEILDDSLPISEYDDLPEAQPPVDQVIGETIAESLMTDPFEVPPPAGAADSLANHEVINDLVARYEFSEHDLYSEREEVLTAFAFSLPWRLGDFGRIIESPDPNAIQQHADILAQWNFTPERWVQINEDALHPPYLGFDGRRRFVVDADGVAYMVTENAPTEMPTIEEQVDGFLNVGTEWADEVRAELRAQVDDARPIEDYDGPDTLMAEARERTAETAATPDPDDDPFEGMTTARAEDDIDPPAGSRRDEPTDLSPGQRFGNIENTPVQLHEEIYETIDTAFRPAGFEHEWSPTGELTREAWADRGFPRFLESGFNRFFVDRRTGEVTFANRADNTRMSRGEDMPPRQGRMADDAGLDISFNNLPYEIRPQVVDELIARGMIANEDEVNRVILHDDGTRIVEFNEQGHLRSHVRVTATDPETGRVEVLGRINFDDGILVQDDMLGTVGVPASAQPPAISEIPTHAENGRPIPPLVENGQRYGDYNDLPPARSAEWIENRQQWVALGSPIFEEVFNQRYFINRQTGDRVWMRTLDETGEGPDLENENAWMGFDHDRFSEAMFVNDIVPIAYHANGQRVRNRHYIQEWGITPYQYDLMNRPPLFVDGDNRYFIDLASSEFGRIFAGEIYGGWEFSDGVPVNTPRSHGDFGMPPSGVRGYDRSSWRENLLRQGAEARNLDHTEIPPVGYQLDLWDRGIAADEMSQTEAPAAHLQDPPDGMTRYNSFDDVDVDDMPAWFTRDRWEAWDEPLIERYDDADNRRRWYLVNTETGERALLPDPDNEIPLYNPYIDYFVGDGGGRFEPHTNLLERGLAPAVIDGPLPLTVEPSPSFLVEWGLTPRIWNRIGRPMLVRNGRLRSIIDQLLGAEIPLTYVDFRTDEHFVNPPPVETLDDASVVRILSEEAFENILQGRMDGMQRPPVSVARNEIAAPWLGSYRSDRNFNQFIFGTMMNQWRINYSDWIQLGRPRLTNIRGNDVLQTGDFGDSRFLDAQGNPIDPNQLDEPAPYAQYDEDGQMIEDDWDDEWDDDPVDEDVEVDDDDDFVLPTSIDAPRHPLQSIYDDGRLPTQEQLREFITEWNYRDVDEWREDTVEGASPPQGYLMASDTQRWVVWSDAAGNVLREDRRPDADIAVPNLGEQRLIVERLAEERGTRSEEEARVVEAQERESEDVDDILAEIMDDDAWEAREREEGSAPGAARGVGGQGDELMHRIQDLLDEDEDVDADDPFEGSTTAGADLPDDSRMLNRYEDYDEFPESEQFAGGRESWEEGGRPIVEQWEGGLTYWVNPETGERALARRGDRYIGSSGYAFGMGSDRFDFNPDTDTIVSPTRTRWLGMGGMEQEHEIGEWGITGHDWVAMGRPPLVVEGPLRGFIDLNTGDEIFVAMVDPDSGEVRPLSGPAREWLDARIADGVPLPPPTEHITGDPPGFYRSIRGVNNQLVTDEMLEMWGIDYERWNEMGRPLLAEEDVSIDFSYSPDETGSYPPEAFQTRRLFWYNDGTAGSSFSLDADGNRVELPDEVDLFTDPDAPPFPGIFGGGPLDPTASDEYLRANYPDLFDDDDPDAPDYYDPDDVDPDDVETPAEAPPLDDEIVGLINSIDQTPAGDLVPEQLLEVLDLDNAWVLGDALFGQDVEVESIITPILQEWNFESAEELVMDGYPRLGYDGNQRYLVYPDGDRDPGIVHVGEVENERPRIGSTDDDLARRREEMGEVSGTGSGIGMGVATDRSMEGVGGYRDSEDELDAPPVTAPDPDPAPDPAPSEYPITSERAEELWDYFSDGVVPENPINTDINNLVDLLSYEISILPEQVRIYLGPDTMTLIENVSGRDIDNLIDEINNRVEGDDGEDIPFMAEGLPLPSVPPDDGSLRTTLIIEGHRDQRQAPPRVLTPEYTQFIADEVHRHAGAHARRAVGRREVVYLNPNQIFGRELEWNMPTDRLEAIMEWENLGMPEFIERGRNRFIRNADTNEEEMVRADVDIFDLYGLRRPEETGPHPYARHESVNDIPENREFEWFRDTDRAYNWDNPILEESGAFRYLINRSTGERVQVRNNTYYDGLSVENASWAPYAYEIFRTSDARFGSDEFFETGIAPAVITVDGVEAPRYLLEWNLTPEEYDSIGRPLLVVDRWERLIVDGATNREILMTHVDEDFFEEEPHGLAGTGTFDTIRIVSDDDGGGQSWLEFELSQGQEHDGRNPRRFADVGPPDDDPFAGVDTRGADDDDARMPPTADELEQRFRDAEEEPDELDDIFAGIEQEMEDAGVERRETVADDPNAHPLTNLARRENRLPTQAEMREHIEEWGYRDEDEWRNDSRAGARPPYPYLIADGTRRSRVWSDGEGNVVDEELLPESDVRPYLTRMEQQDILRGAGGSVRTAQSIRPPDAGAPDAGQGPLLAPDPGSPPMLAADAFPAASLPLPPGDMGSLSNFESYTHVLGQDFHIDADGRLTNVLGEHNNRRHFIDEWMSREEWDDLGQPPLGIFYNYRYFLDEDDIVITSQTTQDTEFQLGDDIPASVMEAQPWRIDSDIYGMFGEHRRQPQNEADTHELIQGMEEQDQNRNLTVQRVREGIRTALNRDLAGFSGDTLEERADVARTTDFSEDLGGIWSLDNPPPLDLMQRMRARGPEAMIEFFQDRNGRNDWMLGDEFAAVNENPNSIRWWDYRYEDFEDWEADGSPRLGYDGVDRYLVYADGTVRYVQQGISTPERYPQIGHEYHGHNNWLSSWNQAQQGNYRLGRDDAYDEFNEFVDDDDFDPDPDDGSGGGAPPPTSSPPETPPTSRQESRDTSHIEGALSGYPVARSPTDRVGAINTETGDVYNVLGSSATRRHNISEWDMSIEEYIELGEPPLGIDADWGRHDGYRYFIDDDYDIVITSEIGEDWRTRWVSDVDWREHPRGEREREVSELTSDASRQHGLELARESIIGSLEHSLNPFDGETFVEQAISARDYYIRSEIEGENFTPDNPPSDDLIQRIRAFGPIAFAEAFIESDDWVFGDEGAFPETVNWSEYEYSDQADWEADDSPRLGYDGRRRFRIYPDYVLYVDRDMEEFNPLYPRVGDEEGGDWQARWDEAVEGNRRMGRYDDSYDDPFAGVDTRGADDDDARMPPTADELEERFRDADEEPDELDDIFTEIEAELDAAGASDDAAAAEIHPLVELARENERLPSQAEMREHITEWGYRDVDDWRADTRVGARPPQPRLMADGHRRFVVWFDEAGNIVHEEQRPNADIPMLTMAEQRALLRGDDDALPPGASIPGAVGTGHHSTITPPPQSQPHPTQLETSIDHWLPSYLSIPDRDTIETARGAGPEGMIDQFHEENDWVFGDVAAGGQYDTINWQEWGFDDIESWREVGMPRLGRDGDDRYVIYDNEDIEFVGTVANSGDDAIGSWHELDDDVYFRQLYNHARRGNLRLGRVEFEEAFPDVRNQVSQNPGDDELGLVLDLLQLTAGANRNEIITIFSGMPYNANTFTQRVRGRYIRDLIETARLYIHEFPDGRVPESPSVDEVDNAILLVMHETGQTQRGPVETLISAETGNVTTAIAGRYIEELVEQVNAHYREVAMGRVTNTTGMEPGEITELFLNDRDVLDRFLDENRVDALITEIEDRIYRRGHNGLVNGLRQQLGISQLSARLVPDLVNDLNNSLDELGIRMSDLDFRLEIDGNRRSIWASYGDEMDVELGILDANNMLYPSDYEGRIEIYEVQPGDEGIQNLLDRSGITLADHDMLPEVQRWMEHQGMLTEGGGNYDWDDFEMITEPISGSQDGVWIRNRETGTEAYLGMIGTGAGYLGSITTEPRARQGGEIYVPAAMPEPPSADEVSMTWAQGHDAMIERFRDENWVFGDASVGRRFQGHRGNWDWSHWGYSEDWMDGFREWRADGEPALGYDGPDRYLVYADGRIEYVGQAPEGAEYVDPATGESPAHQENMGRPRLADPEMETDWQWRWFEAFERDRRWGELEPTDPFEGVDTRRADDDIDDPDDDPVDFVGAPGPGDETPNPQLPHFDPPIRDEPIGAEHVTTYDNYTRILDYGEIVPLASEIPRDSGHSAPIDHLAGDDAYIFLSQGNHYRNMLGEDAWGFIFDTSQLIDEYGARVSVSDLIFDYNALLEEIAEEINNVLPEFGQVPQEIMDEFLDDLVITGGEGWDDVDDRLTEIRDSIVDDVGDLVESITEANNRSVPDAQQVADLFRFRVGELQDQLRGGRENLMPQSEITVEGPLPMTAVIGVIEAGEVRMITEETRGLPSDLWQYEGDPPDDPFEGMDTRGADDDDARMPPTADELDERFRDADEDADELDEFFENLEREMDEAGVERERPATEEIPDDPNLHPLANLALQEERIPSQTEMREYIEEWGYADDAEWRNDTREGASPAYPYLMADGRRRFVLWSDAEGNDIATEERGYADLPMLSMAEQQQILSGTDRIGAARTQDYNPRNSTTGPPDPPSGPSPTAPQPMPSGPVALAPDVGNTMSVGEYPPPNPELPEYRETSIVPQENVEGSTDQHYIEEWGIHPFVYEQLGEPRLIVRGQDRFIEIPGGEIHATRINYTGGWNDAPSLPFNASPYDGSHIQLMPDLLNMLAERLSTHIDGLGYVDPGPYLWSVMGAEGLINERYEFRVEGELEVDETEVAVETMAADAAAGIQTIMNFLDSFTYGEYVNNALLGEDMPSLVQSFHESVLERIDEVMNRTGLSFEVIEELLDPHYDGLSETFWTYTTDYLVEQLEGASSVEVDADDFMTELRGVGVESVAEEHIAEMINLVSDALLDNADSLESLEFGIEIEDYTGRRSVWVRDPNQPDSSTNEVLLGILDDNHDLTPMSYEEFMSTYVGPDEIDIFNLLDSGDIRVPRHHLYADIQGWIDWQGLIREDDDFDVLELIVETLPEPQAHQTGAWVRNTQTGFEAYLGLVNTFNNNLVTVSTQQVVRAGAEPHVPTSMPEPPYRGALERTRNQGPESMIEAFRDENWIFGDASEQGPMNDTWQEWGYPEGGREGFEAWEADGSPALGYDGRARYLIYQDGRMQYVGEAEHDLGQMGASPHDWAIRWAEVYKRDQRWENPE